MDKLERDLKAIVATNTKAIGELMKGAHGMQGLDLSMDKPRELIGSTYSTKRL